jgi:hypothetical protein
MPFIYLSLTLVVVVFAAWAVNILRPVPESIRSIANVAMALIVVGMALWLVNTYVPMAGSIRAILNIVVVVAACVRVLQFLGLWAGVVQLWTDFRNHQWGMPIKNEAGGDQTNR